MPLSARGDPVDACVELEHQEPSEDGGDELVRPEGQVNSTLSR